MMGVYIKGMEMSEIEELVLTKNVQLIFCWTSDMKITAITKAESDSGIVTYSKEFDVVEVREPHGDLIDRSKIGVWWTNDARIAVDHARPVIEAEGK